MIFHFKTKPLFPAMTLIAVMALGPRSLAQTYDVNMNSLPEQVRKNAILHFPELTSHKKIEPDRVDEILKWIHSELDQDIVQFWENDDETYEFKIQKRQRVKEIYFKGLSQISEMEARRLLAIQPNDIFDQDLMISGGERLRKTYQDLGFLNAQVDIEFPTRTDGHINLLILMKENKQTNIEKIEFESQNKKLNDKLNREVRSFFKESFTQESIDRILKRAKEYLIEEKYVRAEISGPQITLNADETLAQLKFHADKVEKYDFQFIGHTNYSIRTLKENMGLDSFYSANSNIGKELTQKIKTFYMSEGYARIDVQAEEKEDKNSQTKILTFQISEGPKIQIEKIQFIGKMSQSEEAYTKLFEKSAPPLIQRGYYSREDVDTAANNFKMQLQNQGYLLAKILTIRTPFNKEKNKVSIILTLEEGPLTEIDSIDFEGNKTIQTTELLKHLELIPKTPLQLEKIESAIQTLKDYYHNLGYLEMNLENEKADLISYFDDNKKAKLKFKIFEGPQVFVSSIILEGNSFTKDQVIFNELDFEKGHILTPQKIEDSVFRLQRTGYFGSVEIKTLEEKTMVSQRTVIIRITEKEPGTFTMGLGFTNERQLTLRGYTGIAYRNLYGTGRGLSFRIEGNYNIADIKYPEYKATAGYLEPYVFQTRNRGRVNVTRSRLISDYSNKKVSETIQTTFSLERDFTAHITGIWDVYSMASSKDFLIDNTSNIPDVLLDIASTGVSLDIDYRDNPFNPTHGTVSKLNVEYASPELRSSRTIKYVKSTASFTFYQPVYKNKVIWANNLRAGYLENLSEEPDGGVPYDKKGFILGGISTIRGFDAGTSDVFPNHTDLGIAENETFYLRQRARMGLFKSEFRFPIYGNLAGAVFYDGGSVVLSEKPFADSYRDSAGFGIRYNTPVGPLILDFGWKLDRREGEDQSKFHLSFGSF